MKLNLEDLSNEKLFDLIKSSADILEKRSNATHLNELLDNNSDGHSNAAIPVKKIYKRGPYKKSHKKTGKQARDYTEIDKIVKEHYGKKSYKKIVEIAAKKGIVINHNSIDNRRRAMGIKPQMRKQHKKKVKKKVKEQTEKEYLKSVEEASKINLDGLNQDKESLKDIQSEADVGEGSCYDE